MPSMRLTAAIAVLLMFCVQISAAEAAGGDLIVGPEMRPLEFDYTVDDGGGVRDGTDAFERSVALGLRGWWAWSAPGRWWAPAVAAEALVADSTYGDGGMRSYGGRLFGGLAWKANDRWGGNLWLATGLGQTYFSIPGDGSFAGLDVSGGYHEYGLVSGVEYAITRHFLAIGELGWWSRDHDLSGDGAAVTVSESGPSLLIGVAYRFGGAPSAVE